MIHHNSITFQYTFKKNKKNIVAYRLSLLIFIDGFVRSIGELDIRTQLRDNVVAGSTPKTFVIIENKTTDDQRRAA